MKVVERVGEIKNESGGAIYRPEREKAIIERLELQSKAVNGALNKSAIEAIFLEIFAVSRNLERPENIKLTTGGVICDIKIDEEISILCRNKMNRMFQLKFSFCLIFQKLTDQEKVLLSALKYLQ